MCASTLNLREATPILLATKKISIKTSNNFLPAALLQDSGKKNSSGALTQDTKSSISKTKQHMYRISSWLLHSFSFVTNAFLSKDSKKQSMKKMLAEAMLVFLAVVLHKGI
jgi:hypothetical protein